MNFIASLPIISRSGQTAGYYRRDCFGWSMLYRMNKTPLDSDKGEINHLPCVFARALLVQGAVCEQARSSSQGARAAVNCASPLARSACGTLYGLLCDKSSFVLHLTGTRRALPPATAMKIQCGGLSGLKQVIAPEAHAADVHRLVRVAVENFGSLDALPFSEIVKGVAGWSGEGHSR